MSKTARWLVAAGGVAALVVLFLVLRPSDEPAPTPSASTSPSATTSPSPTATETASTPTLSPTEAPSTLDAVEVEVELEGDRVDLKRDGEDISNGRIEVTQGDHVVVTVQADVADEVHLHGYDLMADVAPGSPATIELDATVAGIFECELEDAGRVLFELEVTP